MTFNVSIKLVILGVDVKNDEMAVLSQCQESLSPPSIDLKQFTIDQTKDILIKETVIDDVSWQHVKFLTIDKVDNDINIYYHFTIPFDTYIKDGLYWLTGSHIYNPIVVEAMQKS